MTQLELQRFADENGCKGLALAAIHIFFFAFILLFYFIGLGETSTPAVLWRKLLIKSQFVAYGDALGIDRFWNERGARSGGSSGGLAAPGDRLFQAMGQIGDDLEVKGLLRQGDIGT